MRKSQRYSKKPSKGYGFCEVPDSPTPTKFVDRNLMAINPLKQQFEPTEASPIRRHVKMAGGA